MSNAERMNAILKRLGLDKRVTETDDIRDGIMTALEAIADRLDRTPVYWFQDYEPLNEMDETPRTPYLRMGPPGWGPKQPQS